MIHLNDVVVDVKHKNIRLLKTDFDKLVYEYKCKQNS